MVEDYLRTLVERARSVLGDGFVGAYVTGSVALGAYQPGRSDVDVALVCAGSLAPEVKCELVARLRHEALACPARGLELVVYSRAAAGSGSPEPSFELELNTGARMDFRVTFSGEERPLAEGWFWYGLDRDLLHQTGRTLSGPPAAEVFAGLAPDDLRTLLVTALRWWLATPAGSASDAVLGASRALVRVRDGVWLSKIAAGRRAVALGVVSGALVEQAVEARSGGEAPDADEARRFQRRVLAELTGDPAG